jgi:hypothetical protein
MTTGPSQVSSLNSLFANIYEDTVFSVHEQVIAMKLCKFYVDGKGAQTRNLNYFPTITPVSVGETDDISNPTVFGKTSITTLTPGEIGSQTLVTDLMRETLGDEDIISKATMELSQGAADKIDGDILAGGTAFTGGSVGATGSTMTWGYLYAAVANLRAAKVPRPYYAVLHPNSWEPLMETAAVGATVTNAPAFQDEAMRQFWVGNLPGLDGIFYSANVKTVGNDAFNLVFNPWALAFDLRRAIRVEPERDASKRAYELTMTANYAAGVWRPAFGVMCVALASTIS